VKTLDTVREMALFLKRGGIESAEQEAGKLVIHGLEVNNVEMYRDNPVLSEKQISNIKTMVRRRIRREPLQYILGHEEFLGLKLLVGTGVLIPRPETEFMAEHAISIMKQPAMRAGFSVLDVCTGSGCLALAIAGAFPHAEVYGTDISGTALDYAHLNAGVNRVRNVCFLLGPFFQPVKKAFSKFDLIISNPPYIKRGNIEDLQPEIRDWEPRIALDGGADGLEVYRELIPGAGSFLKKNGRIMLEVGAGQAQSVADIMESYGYTRIELTRDLAGIERIVQAQWNK
jgi:release factor glutamine methyltransferase